MTSQTWEFSKENIQPLRGGRDLEFSSENKILIQKRHFEEELRLYTGDDPLDVWFRYIQWYDKIPIESGTEGDLKQLMTKCIDKFLTTKKYHTDRRFIYICLNYVSRYESNNTFFEYMFDNGIGTKFAKMYCDWAEREWLAGNVKFANKIYLSGLSKDAEPKEMLQNQYEDFQARVTRNQVMKCDEYENTAEDESRSVLKPLPLLDNKAPIVRICEPEIVKMPHHADNSMQKQEKKFTIFNENNECKKLISNGDWRKRPAPDTENIIQPKPWVNEKLPVNEMLHDISKEPPFKIHIDEKTIDNAQKNSLQLSSHRKPLKSLKIKQDPSNTIVQRFTEWTQPNERPMYTKDKVYAGNDEFQFEEIRTLIWRRQQQQKLEFDRRIEEEKAKIREELIHEIRRSHAENTNGARHTYSDSANFRHTSGYSSYSEPTGSSNMETLKTKRMSKSNFDSSATVCTRAALEKIGNMFNQSLHITSSEASSSPSHHDSGLGFSAFSEKIDTNGNIKNIDQMEANSDQTKIISSSMDKRQSVDFSNTLTMTDFADRLMSTPRDGTKMKSTSSLPKSSENDNSNTVSRKQYSNVPFTIFTENKDLKRTRSKAPFKIHHDNYSFKKPVDLSASSKLTFTEDETIEKGSGLSSGAHVKTKAPGLQVFKACDSLTECEQADNLVNPFDAHIKEGFLQDLEIILSDYPGYIDVDKEIIHNINSSTVIPISTGNNIRVVNLLGEGAYANIYAVVPSQKFKSLCRGCRSLGNISVSYPMALKVENPGNFWEFYCVQELHRRLSQVNILPNIHPSIVSYYAGFFFKNGSALLSKNYDYGTLLDFVNFCKQNKISLSRYESFIMYLTIEMLHIVHYCHQAGFIHADIKPDNFLLMSIPSLNIRATGIRDLLTGNHLQLLHLIEFGRAIDMTKFPSKTCFTAKVKTSAFECIEMKLDKPWTYQIDYYGIVGTINVLITGDYMKIVNKNNVWEPAAKPCRMWNVELWQNFFHELLNVSNCSNLPSLQKWITLFTNEFLMSHLENFATSVKVFRDFFVSHD